MRIDIVSVLPELMQSPFETSILKRAVEKGLVEVHFHHLRDWGLGKHRQIDDEPYGGGAGMVMMIEPLDACLSELKSQREYDEVIYLTPDGETLNQRISNTLSIQKKSDFSVWSLQRNRSACARIAYHQRNFYRRFRAYGRRISGLRACRFSDTASARSFK